MPRLLCYCCRVEVHPSGTAFAFPLSGTADELAGLVAWLANVLRPLARVTVHPAKVVLRRDRVRALVVYLMTLQVIHPGGDDEPFALVYGLCGHHLAVDVPSVRAWLRCLRAAGFAAETDPASGSARAKWLWLGWAGARVPRTRPLTWLDVKMGRDK